MDSCKCGQDTSIRVMRLRLSSCCCQQDSSLNFRLPSLLTLLLTPCLTLSRHCSQPATATADPIGVTLIKSSGRGPVTAATVWTALTTRMVPTVNDVARTSIKRSKDAASPATVILSVSGWSRDSQTTLVVFVSRQVYSQSHSVLFVVSPTARLHPASVQRPRPVHV